MIEVSERVLLFIPMYNCERQISRVIRQLIPTMDRLFSEIIIIDNRSTDESQRVAIETLKQFPELPAKVLVNHENYGLGGSHKVAFNYALNHNFDYCVVLHGDDQGRVADLVDLVGKGLHRTVDCLLGARFMKGSQLNGYSVFRTLGNRVFNQLYSVVAGQSIRDLGSGLNLYFVQTLADRSYLRNPDDLTFNYYMILRSIADGWRIRFFPISWREEDQISNVKLFRQAFRVLSIALEYAFDRKQFLYKDCSRQSGQSYSATVIFENDSLCRPVPLG
jgi:dolichol-phosphate mannosyltransferase